MISQLPSAVGDAGLILVVTLELHVLHDLPIAHQPTSCGGEPRPGPPRVATAGASPPGQEGPAASRAAAVRRLPGQGGDSHWRASEAGCWLLRQCSIDMARWPYAPAQARAGTRTGALAMPDASSPHLCTSGASPPRELFYHSVHREGDSHRATETSSRLALAGGTVL